MHFRECMVALQRFKTLKKPSASVLHGLNELESINLIKKNFKSYALTSKGILYAVSLKKLFRDLYIFRTHTDFLQDHSIESIPAEFFRNSYLLKDSYFVESDEENLSKPRDKILQLLGSCDDMRIIMPIFLEDYLERIIENLERGNDLILITNDLVFGGGVEKLMYDLVMAWHEKYDITVMSYKYDDRFYDFKHIS